MEEIEEYAEAKLWFLAEDNGLVLGVTASGLSELGTIVELELPEPGESYDVGDDMGAIHGRDGDLRIEAPAAIKIVERNHEVMMNPNMLEDDPTGDGWILRCEAE